MPLDQVAIMSLNIFFAVMEKMNKTQEEQLIFYAEQRKWFHGENAPENLPKPPGWKPNSSLGDSQHIINDGLPEQNSQVRTYP